MSFPRWRFWYESRGKSKIRAVVVDSDDATSDGPSSYSCNALDGVINNLKDELTLATALYSRLDRLETNELTPERTEVGTAGARKMQEPLSPQQQES